MKKHRLLTLAGALALLAVLGRFYALPAIAQTVRAALVQDVDNSARNYITLELSDGNPYTVPAGKVLVLEYILGGPATFASGAGWALSFNGDALANTNNNRWDLFISPIPCNSAACPVNQPVHVYAKAGQTLVLNGFAPLTTNEQLYFQGYLVNAN